MIPILLLCASSLKAQAPSVVQNQAAAWASGTSISKTLTLTAGNSLRVSCNAPAGKTFANVTDSQGDAFQPLSGAAPVPTSQTLFVYFAATVKGGSTKVNCLYSAAPGGGEQYDTELSGVESVDLVSTFSGVSGSAIGQILTTQPNDLVLAGVVSGTVTSKGTWTTLSSFDSNLVASQSAPLPATVSAAFGVTSDWILSLEAYSGSPPQTVPTYSFTFAGGPRVSFPIANASSVPACLPADGACSITIQFLVPSGTGACVTGLNGDTTCTGTAGSVFLVKSYTGSDGTVQTLTMPVAVATVQ